MKSTYLVLALAVFTNAAPNAAPEAGVDNPTANLLEARQIGVDCEVWGWGDLDVCYLSFNFDCLLSCLGEWNL